MVQDVKQPQNIALAGSNIKDHVDLDLRTKVSRYISYLLRHNPEDLEMDKYGLVDIDELHKKLRQRFHVDKRLIFEITEESRRKRFEIVGNNIRALYGHTIHVEQELIEEKAIKVLYHGTTYDSAMKILREGLKPMRRAWVHLSPTVEVAREVGLRRTRNPTILAIDVEVARKEGIAFYKATDKVYLCGRLLPKYIMKTRTPQMP